MLQNHFFLTQKKQRWPRPPPSPPQPHRPPRGTWGEAMLKNWGLNHGSHGDFSSQPVGFWWRISMVLTCLNHQNKENHWILSYPKSVSPLFFWLHRKSPSPVRCLTGPLTTPSKVTFLGAISLMPGALPNNMEVSLGFLMAGIPPSHHRFQYKNVRMTWMIWGTMT